MKLPLKIITAFLLIAISGVAFWTLIKSYGFDVLEPAGAVSVQQRNIFIFAVALSLIVVIPVFALTAYVVWNYRETHAHAPRFDPTFESSPKAEFVWWSVPVILIAILGIVIWSSSHQLDPYKPLASSKPALNVQVVALDWKWLFIYPDQGVASVNYLQVPTGRPINFVLTSDAPMTSFWIPKLGGQIYAMSGMTTKLHLQADQTGEFTGKNANISGEGYSGMTFKVKADSDMAFNEWVQTAKAVPDKLTTTSYAQLAKPTKNVAAKQYVLASGDLFDSVIMKYMAPAKSHTAGVSHSGMEHANE